MLVFFVFPVGKVQNIPTKCGSATRTTKICLFSAPAIFPVPRREIIKNCEKISRNHESGGHNFDTIKYIRMTLLCGKINPAYSVQSTYFWTLYFRKIKLILCMANYSNARQKWNSKWRFIVAKVYAFGTVILKQPYQSSAFYQDR